MNLPAFPVNKEMTMSLKEITDLLGVRHDKACLKVLAMAEEPEFGAVSISDIVYNDRGQTITTYQLNQRQSIAVASRLNTALLMRVIDRWQELEQQVSAQQLPDFNNPVAAARAWADAKESEQKALAQIEASKPALLVYEALANRRMDCNTTTLAKQLDTTATKLNIFLKSHGIKFKHQDLPMATHANWFNVVTGVAKNGYETIQCLITPLGQIEIAKLWHKGAV